MSKMNANKDFELLFRVTKEEDPNFKPDTVDIAVLADLFHSVSNLVEAVSGEREVVTHRMEEGSLRSYFTFASLQTKIAMASAFGVLSSSGMVALNPATAKQIEILQENARKWNLTYEVSDPKSHTKELAVISPTTNYKKQEDRIVDEETYLYGEVFRAGGQKTGKISLLTDAYGVVELTIPKEKLAEFEQNILYSSDLGFKVIGKRNLRTNEFESKQFEFLEVIKYSPKYDESYLKGLQKKARAWVSEIADPSEYVAKLRGY